MKDAADVRSSAQVLLAEWLSRLVISILPRSRGRTSQALEWILNAYNLTFAVLLLTGAALGDRLGRRRMFVAGLVLFVAASIAQRRSSQQQDGKAEVIGVENPFERFDRGAEIGPDCTERGHNNDGVEDHHEGRRRCQDQRPGFASTAGSGISHGNAPLQAPTSRSGAQMRSGEFVLRPSGVLGVDHIARDRLELGEGGDVLQISSDVGILSECFDVCAAAPLRIDEHAPTVLALEDAGGDPSGHLGEHGVGGFSQELDQLGLVFGLDRRNIDLSYEVTIDCDCRLHAGIPLLAVRCNGLKCEDDTTR